MKNKKFLRLLVILSAVGMIYSVIALFNASAFTDVPGRISQAEKGFWTWIWLGNGSLLTFIISLFNLGDKEQEEKK